MSAASPAVRPAAVAGAFYPGDAATLRRELAGYLGAASPAPSSATAPKAIIVPHAGYIYSAPVAASAYARIAPLKGRIRRVVLLGPCHRVAVRGLAAPGVAHYATPLGLIPIDRAAIDRLADLPQVVIDDAAHAQEHSLEVQLPFLQTLLGEFSLVPLAVGQADSQEVAQVLERLWGGEETLVVISSDLSHYHPYAEARQIDEATARQIVAGTPLGRFDQACGALPINGVLEVARRQRLAVELLDLRNSGDTAGDKARVVGYAAFSIAATPAAATDSTDDDALGAALLARATNALAAHFAQAQRPAPDHPALAQPGATFVTLTQAGQLRGCIGSLEAHRPLAEDVCANALAAALRDPRFPPLRVEELAHTRVEVSLLTAPQAMSFADEADALRQLRPGIDGVIFSAGARRSTFLPQVWEQLPEPRLFMAHLKQKAGLGADYWSPEVRLARYAVKKWRD